MCMCTHVHACVRQYVPRSERIYNAAAMYVCIHVYMCVYTCVYIYVYICMCTCVCVSVCAVCVCLCVRVCVYNVTCMHDRCTHLAHAYHRLAYGVGIHVVRVPVC